MQRDPLHSPMPVGMGDPHEVHCQSFMKPGFIKLRGIAAPTNHSAVCWLIFTLTI